MARPQKQIVDYFPHYAGASNGKTLFIIQSRFGNDGYACWFKLLELLASTEGHYFDYSKPADWQFLLAKTGVSADTLTELLATLADLEAIDRELYLRKIIWSQHFVDNLASCYGRRKVDFPRKPGVSVNNNSINVDNNPVSVDNNPQSKVKESKGNDSREGGMGETDTLYKVLEATKGFPKYSQENSKKLHDAITDYPGLNYMLEFKKFREYWNSRQLKRPWLALRNWLEKAKGANAKAQGRRLPKEYTEIEYPDL